LTDQYVTEFTASRGNGHRRPRGYAGWRPHASTLQLLADVDAVLERYADHLPLTIRQVFYALVGAEQLDKTERAYARLCEHLNRARRARLIEFGALRDDGVTVMESRSYRGVEDFHDETGRRAKLYRRDRQASQTHYVEFWCEAQGMMPQLQRVADPFSVPVYSAGGFASLSAVRHIADRAVSRSVPTVLLHVGDFDPSGESIFTAMTGDAAAFVEADRVLTTCRIDAVRVALTREQVTERGLPSAPAKASDSRSQSWKGGTCQLEALPPDVLAELVREAILGQFDQDTLSAVREVERRERAQLLGLGPGAALIDHI
jgi:hypothetical protein